MLLKWLRFSLDKSGIVRLNFAINDLILIIEQYNIDMIRFYTVKIIHIK